MPPTFLIFLAAIAYIGLTTVTCIVSVPILFIETVPSGNDWDGKIII